MSTQFLPVYVFRVSMAGGPERETRIPCASFHRLIGRRWHGWFDLDLYEPQPRRVE
jgi:hypothetical protein